MSIKSFPDGGRVLLLLRTHSLRTGSPQSPTLSRTTAQDADPRLALPATGLWDPRDQSQTPRMDSPLPEPLAEGHPRLAHAPHHVVVQDVGAHPRQERVVVHRGQGLDPVVLHRRRSGRGPPAAIPSLIEGEEPVPVVALRTRGGSRRAPYSILGPRSALVWVRGGEGSGRNTAGRAPERGVDIQSCFQWRESDLAWFIVGTPNPRSSERRRDTHCLSPPAWDETVKVGAETEGPRVLLGDGGSFVRPRRSLSDPASTPLSRAPATRGRRP